MADNTPVHTNVERITRAIWELQQGLRELEERVRAVESLAETRLVEIIDKVREVESRLKAREERDT